MDIEKLADGDIEIEEQVEKYAPMTILGRNHPDDNKVGLFCSHFRPLHSPNSDCHF